MPVQPQLFPDSSAGPSGQSQRAPGIHEVERNQPESPVLTPEANLAPIWLQRLSLFILVTFCIYLGIIVTLLPWLFSVWDHNMLFIAHPHLWAILRLGPVRGFISGLGLLDIWIGISEAIHYHDQKA